ncbi:MAG: methyl-accepting chemotaxis protein [Spirochaetes bacterium]|nr:methyl-accepting chemotaxis protein [Spirochaetota bacterium]
MGVPFLNRLSIFAKLSLLAFVVVIAFSGNFLIAYKSFGDLNFSIRFQGSSSELLVKTAAFHALVYTSLVDLYQVQAEAITGSTYVTGAIQNFEESLSRSTTELSRFTDMETDEETRDILSDTEKGYQAFSEAATKAVSEFRTGSVQSTTLMSIARIRFNALAAVLLKLDESMKAKADESASLATSASSDAIRTLAIVSSLVFIFVIGFVILTVRSISKPIGVLVGALEKAGDGDLTMAVGSKAKDEIGKISSSVDDLVVDLRGLVQTVKERISALEETTNGLSSNMEETGAAVVQINTNIQSTKGQLGEQSEAVAEVSSAMDRLVGSVDSLTSLISSQSAMIADSSAAVEEMIANVDSVASSAEGAASASNLLIEEGSQGTSKINDVMAAVSSIVQYSENLNAAVEVITGIADRTNLLAMNAAIEAAHAGEAGRGFAVVADEIGKLSTQSNEQAKDISRDLGKVAEAIDSVKKATDATVQSFTSILEKSGSLGDAIGSIGASMAEQRDGGRLVLDVLGRLREITGSISDGSAKMEQGNASILRQVERLRSVNIMVVQNNEEISQGTREINEAIANTMELCSRTGELVSEVKLAADKFTV